MQLILKLNSAELGLESSAVINRSSEKTSVSFYSKPVPLLLGGERELAFGFC